VARLLNSLLVAFIVCIIAELFVNKWFTGPRTQVGNCRSAFRHAPAIWYRCLPFSLCATARDNVVVGSRHWVSAWKLQHWCSELARMYVFGRFIITVYSYVTYYELPLCDSWMIKSCSHVTFCCCWSIELTHLKHTSWRTLNIKVIHLV